MLVASWIVLAALAEPSNPIVEIRGATSCPAPAEVEAALAGLTGPSGLEPASDAGETTADVAELTADGDTVLVTLRRASGEPVGEKRLDAGQACDERARAAAVVIAAWEARLATQAGALVVAPPPPKPATVAQFPMPAAKVLPTDVPTHLEAGINLGGSVNGTRLAPAASIELAIERPNALLIPAVAGLFVGSHSMTVGGGEGTWRRFGLLATVASRRSRPPNFLEARAGAALTWLDIAGSSYPLNNSGVTFDPGLTIGVRGGLRLVQTRWWVDVAIVFWPRGQEVYVSGQPGSAVLPRGEALLSLGAAYAIL